MKIKPFTILNYIFLVLFFLSAVVQYNDPDALLWMLLYGIAALICLLTAFGRLHWGISALMAFVTLGLALILAPQVIGKVSFSELFVSMEMKTEVIEQAREMGGLLIIAVWMIVIAVIRYRQLKLA
jgi:hypothetical protein